MTKKIEYKQETPPSIKMNFETGDAKNESIE